MTWQEKYCKRFGLCKVIRKKEECQCYEEIAFITTLLAEQEKEIRGRIRDEVHKFAKGSGSYSSREGLYLVEFDYIINSISYYDKEENNG